MAARRRKRSDCRNGIHRPNPITRTRDGEVLRSVCRDCGCHLVRTAATRRWFLSGLLA